jgi:hypothetical protein
MAKRANPGGRFRYVRADRPGRAKSLISTERDDYGIDSLATGLVA